MDSPAVDIGPALGIAAVVAVLLTIGVARWAQLGTGTGSLTASIRAVIQLGAVALLLDVIVESFPASLGFVLFMTLVASGTAARRITKHRSGLWAAVPIASGALPVAAGLLACGVVPTEGVAIIPIAGILVGGTMTATVLAGRRGLDDLITRRGEYEAGLAIGLTGREAALEIVRPAGEAALIPPLDQTRTVGLVTLPGAFVGMLLGGATPAEAGAVQLLVLVTLLATQTIGVALLIELICRGRIVRPPLTAARSSSPVPRRLAARARFRGPRADG